MVITDNRNVVGKRIMEKTLPATLTTFSLSLKPQFTPPSSYPNFSLYPRHPLCLSSTCRCRRPATGANEGDGEFGRSWRRRRRWWSESDMSPDLDTGYGVVEELVDSIWIFKVFRFYGWWLPPILISWLLATGLKAFLLALAVSIGLSMLALAFNKLWGLVDNPKRGSRVNKKKPRGRTTRKVDIQEEWVPNDDEKSTKGEDSSSFKGWDELDGVEEFDEGTMRRSTREGRSRREEKFIRRERGGEMPLLLRLLVAVFPFLGSWTKML